MDQADNTCHGMLLVVGDQAVQRHVYDATGSAYWSAQFGLVLEKNGLLDFEVAGQDVLARPEFLARFPIVIVGWLPEVFWRQSYIDTLRAYEGVLVIEGPPPPALERTLGLRRAADSTSLDGEIEIVDPALRQLLAERYAAFLKGGRIVIKPKNVRTRPVRPNRWDNDADLETLAFPDIARRIVRSFRIPFWNRLLQGNPFPLVRDELLSLYVLLCDHVKGGDVPPGGLPALAARFAALAPQVESPLESTIAAGIRQFLGDAAAPAPATRRASRPVSHRLRTLWRHWRSRRRELSAPSDRLLQTLIALPLADPPERLPGEVAARLRAHVEGDLILEETRVMPRRRLTLAELALCAITLKVLGRGDEAERVLRLCLDAGFDEETGRFTNVRLGPAGRETLSHHSLSPTLALAFLTVLDDTTEPPFVGRSFRERYGAARLDAWQAAPHRLRSYAATAGQAPAVVHGRGAGPAVVRNGKRLCFTFEALSYIVYYHTMHPLDGPFTDCDASGALALEALFLALLHEQAGRHDAGLIRIEPWPWGDHYCFTLRHDVDRIPDEATFETVMHVSTSAGLGVTWCWLPNRLRADYIARQEAAGHEIALHALKHERKKREIVALARRLTRQPRIYGEFVHGGGGGEYWLGYPTVEAARHAGLDYAEGMSTYYDFPYRFPFLAADGGVRFEDVISLSHTFSIDRAVPDREGGAGPWYQGRVDAAIRNSFYLMVLSHPDKNLARLQQLLSELPAQGRRNWTCRQVADWWRATHCRDRLSVSRTPGVEGYVLSADDDVEDLALRLVGVAPARVRRRGAGGDASLEVRACPGLYGGADALVRLNLRKGRDVRLEVLPAAERGAAGERHPHEVSDPACSKPSSSTIGRCSDTAR